MGVLQTMMVYIFCVRLLRCPFYRDGQYQSLDEQDGQQVQALTLFYLIITANVESPAAIFNPMKLKLNFFMIVTTILCSVFLISCGDKDKPDTIEASPSDINLDFSANSSNTVNIKSSGEWHISSKPQWIDVSPLSGSGNENVTITAISENESTSPRSESIDFKTGSATASVQITQAGKELDILELNPTSISLVSNANSSASVNITCNGAWEITSHPEWLNISSTKGKGNTMVIITALTENDSASPRTGNIEVVSGVATASLQISQVGSLEPGCEVTIIDEVILYDSATFRVNFGPKASYFYAAYFPVSSAGWSDNKIVEELEKSGTPMTVENGTDLTADDLNESTSYIQCFVAYNEKGKRGEVIRRNFTTPSSRNAPIAYIEDVYYSTTKWHWSTKISATAQEYYMLVYGGDTAFLFAYLLEPSDMGMIFKDKINDLTSYVNSQDWNVTREEGEMDLLICTWAQRDKKWSPVLNMFYGSISSEEMPDNTERSLPRKTMNNAHSHGRVTPHYPEQREMLKRHFRVLKK